MSNTLTLQPGRFQYIGGTDKDSFVNVGLNNSKSLLDDQDLFRVVNALQQAQAERVASRHYRVHGTINPISFLTNKPSAWTIPQDLIAHTVTTDLATDFEICLGYIAKYVPMPTLGANYYERRMKIVATKAEVDVLPCGFAKNVFSEPQYNFMLNGDLDLTDIIADGLGAPWPVTDLLVYLRPLTAFTTLTPTNPADTHVFAPDTVYGFHEFDPQGTQAILATNLVRFTRPATLTGITDSDWSSFIYPEVVSLFRLGDVKLTPGNIELNEAYIRAWTGLERFTATLTGQQVDSDGLLPVGISYFDPITLEIRDVTHLKFGLTRTLTLPNTAQNRAYIQGLRYSYETTGTDITTTLGFLYEPVQSVSVRQFSDFIEQGDPNDTVGIPENALPVSGTTDFQWRDLLDPGYIEPSSGRGNNSPFVNGCHYVYAPLTFVIGPDLTNPNTFQAFRSTRITLANPSFRL